MIDPQLRGIFRRFAFWRRFCRHFPDRRDGFVARVGLVHRRSKIGPAVAFQQSLHDLGWICGNEGILTHSTSGIRLNWLNDSMTHLKMIFQNHVE